MTGFLLGQSFLNTTLLYFVKLVKGEGIWVQKDDLDKKITNMRSMMKYLDSRICPRAENEITHRTDKYLYWCNKIAVYNSTFQFPFNYHTCVKDLTTPVDYYTGLHFQYFLSHSCIIVL